MAFDAIVENLASPFDPGTAYVLQHHAFGEVNGKKEYGATPLEEWGRLPKPWLPVRVSAAQTSKPTLKLRRC